MFTFLKRLIGIHQQDRANKKLTWKNARTWPEWEKLERRGDILILADRGMDRPTIHWRPDGFGKKRKKMVHSEMNEGILLSDDVSQYVIEQTGQERQLF